MAWTDPKTWVSGEDVDFNEFNTHIRDNFNETAPGVASAAGRLIVTDGANSIVERIPSVATPVLTAETTTSTTFGDLATAGPAVTVETGTQALVIFTAQMANNTAGEWSAVSYTVSGATTIAANLDYALIYESSVADDLIEFGFSIVVGLTAGSNVFTLRYRTGAGGGTSTIERRRLSVVPF